MMPGDIPAAARLARGNLDLLLIYPAERNVAVGPGRPRRQRSAIKLRGDDRPPFVCGRR
jgi:hypothetical protein